MINICNKLTGGSDFSCSPPTGTKHYQQAVVMNYDDVDFTTLVAPWTDLGDGLCGKVTAFSLKEGTTGNRFSISERGTAINGYVSLVTNEQGYATYTHNVTMVVSAENANDICQIDALAKGKFVVALQLNNGEVELFGLQKGLFLADGDIDIQSNGGLATITLSSLDGQGENYPQMFYIPTAGSAGADFDSNFENEEIIGG